MLDQFNTDEPDDYIAGFPDHPHRGFNTFTYMRDGHMQHGDSMGNRGDLAPGGAQWMKAGSGMIHSDVNEAATRLNRFFTTSTDLMKVMARACGHDHLNGFCIDDLTTFDRKISHLTGIGFAGVSSD